MREMMDNAKWRDEKRESKVKKYREETAKEEAEYKSRGASDHAGKFTYNFSIFLRSRIRINFKPLFRKAHLKLAAAGSS